MKGYPFGEFFFKEVEDRGRNTTDMLALFSTPATASVETIVVAVFEAKASNQA